MCCAVGVVLSKNQALCPAASYSHFSSINKSYSKNNPDISGFWCVARERYLLTFFKENYYV
jgi:hypothetical protein